MDARLLLPAVVRFLVGIGLAIGAPDIAAAQQARSEASVFEIESAGATAGSLAGAIAAYQLLNATRGACGTDDLSCLIGRLGVMGVVTTVGAAAGGHLTGRAADTGPSGWGSLLGALVGVGGGVAAAKGLAEPGARGRWSQALGYTVTQGLLTAAGSRLLARQ